MHLFRFFDLVGKREGWTARASGVASEPFLFDYDYDPTLNAGKGKLRNEALARECERYPIVILASLWGSVGYNADPSYLPSLDKTLKRLTSEGKHVIMPYSCYEHQQPRIRESYLVYRGFLPLDEGRYTPEELKGGGYATTYRNAQKIRQFVKEHYPQVVWVNLVDLLPQSLLYKGMPVMADTHHLNDYGAEVLATLYRERGLRLIPQAWLAGDASTKQ